ncbi:MAG: DNA translocase FtsK [Gemmataceae bacterium]|nr:DNA translocase FtsK [Gemmataceae bacterium]
MPSPRAWRLDLAVAVLLAIGAAIATEAGPARFLAQELRAALGEAVWAWHLFWLAGCVALLRRGWGTWLPRAFGFLLLVPACAALAHVLGGDGGAIGEWLEAHLRRLPPAWRSAALIGTTALGAALAVGFVVVRSLKLAWHSLPRRKPKPVAVVPAPEPAKPAVTAVKAAPDKIPIVYHGLPALPEPQLSNGLASEAERFAGFELPPLSLLEDPKPFDQAGFDAALRDRAGLLEQTCRDFGLNIKVVGISTGPVVTMYEVTLETGVRVAKIVSLADDLALNLKVPSVRIVAPIPGKNAVGLEVPNEHRADVRLKEVIQTTAPEAAKLKVPVFLGKDAQGRPLVRDLADMPHLLIAGTTGTGKSVCLNAIILSLLMTRRPDETKLVMIDPKAVEMECYSRVPHLMSPIISDMKKAEAVLAWAVDKMEERYDLLRRARVRSIAAFNELGGAEVVRRVKPEEEEKARLPERLPYIVIVIDEMADMMMQMKREVEGHIIRLAQKSRAAGIHLILATQKPTVDVVTGLIKSNLPSRICFKVAQKSDSRVVLDVMGADKLLSRGDMLFLPPGTSDLVRAQGAFASDAEIARVAEWLDSDPCYEAELLQLKTREAREAEAEGGSLAERLKSRDALYEQAVEVVIASGRGSVSMLQRSLGIGYGRAARLIDFMAEDGIVGDYQGSNAREVKYTPEQWAAAKGAG